MKIMISFRLDEDVLKRFDETCERQGWSRSEGLVKAVDKLLETGPRRPPAPKSTKFARSAKSDVTPIEKEKP